MPLYRESIHARRKYGWAPLRGLIDWPWKFISAPAPELYDLGKDPDESNNIYSPERAAVLEERLLAIGAPASPSRPSRAGRQSRRRSHPATTYR